MSLTPCFNSSNTVMLRWSIALAYIVGSMPLGLRSRRRTRSTCSRLAIASDTAGWDIASCRAALTMLPDFTTVERM